MSNDVHGYKVFDADWSCRGKQYTCPGSFTEDVYPELGERGMHFCTSLQDCFQYHTIDTVGHIAEVIAVGDIVCSNEDSNCCTNQLNIIAELNWTQVFSIIIKESSSSNINVGFGNSGANNLGNNNTGSSNVGYRNTGFYNRGDWNFGSFNIGSDNNGNNNQGSYNYGTDNHGTNNRGISNIGEDNFGIFNRGKYNLGSFNFGDNIIGCFNTENNQKIYMFNKESNWTYKDWVNSDAYTILLDIPTDTTSWDSDNCISAEVKSNTPDYLITKGMIKACNMENHFEDIRQTWWMQLPDLARNEILNLPNFDAKIFKQCTGIDVNKEIEVNEDEQNNEVS